MSSLEESEAQISYLAGHPSTFWTFFPSCLPGLRHVAFTTRVWNQRWVCRNDFVKNNTWPHTVWSTDHDLCCSLFHPGPMVESKVFKCTSAAELQKWMQHIEDRRHKSISQTMNPSHCALSYLVITCYIHGYSCTWYTALVRLWIINCLHVSPSVTMWWALEKRRVKKILTTGSNMAVGGLAHTAHGSARIHICRPYEQHTETGHFSHF